MYKKFKGIYKTTAKCDFHLIPNCEITNKAFGILSNTYKLSLYFDEYFKTD
jgi:hypothetical protein